jgi:sec-independent protein translocase protein TatA
MGFDALSPWHLLILAAVVVLLFAKKLPDSARSLGRALRIFKAETAGLRDGGTSEDPQSSLQAPATGQALPQSPAVRAEDASASMPEAQRTGPPN